VKGTSKWETTNTLMDCVWPRQMGQYTICVGVHDTHHEALFFFVNSYKLNKFLNPAGEAIYSASAIDRLSPFLSQSPLQQGSKGLC